MRFPRVPQADHRRAAPQTPHGRPPIPLAGFPAAFPAGDACARCSPRATPLTHCRRYLDNVLLTPVHVLAYKRPPLNLPARAPHFAARHCRRQGENAPPPAPTDGQATEHLA
jgi:hypothetical protein